MADNKRLNVLRETMRGFRPILFFSVGISLVYGLLRLAGPLFMILIFDRVLPSQSEATLVSLLLILIIILGVMTLLDYSRRRVLARFGAQFQEQIEDHILSSTARDSYVAREGSKPAGGLNSTDRLRAFFHSGSLVNILDFLWSPIFLAVIFIISPFIGFTVLAGLALLAFLNLAKFSLGRSLEERRAEANETIGDLKDTLLVSRHVLETQQMLAAFNKRWLVARRTSRDRAVEHKDVTGWFTAIASHVPLMLQYVTLAVAAYLTIEGELTVGSMVAAMVLTRLTANATGRFLKQYPSIVEAREHWRILDNALSSAPTPTAVADGASTLSLHQVTARCAVTKNKLLRNVNVEIEPGTSVQIIGGAGSGKTVLAEALIGRFPRTMGKIKFGAIEIERLSIAESARRIGYVPQYASFISGTIEENIAGLEERPNCQRVVQSARTVQMHDRILSLPEGYQTIIDTSGSLFGKGERHGLALARALYSEPNILIVDEPDTSFREGLAKGLKDDIDRFLGRGGILIILTRIALKAFEPTRSFTLNEGVLKENEPEPKPDDKEPSGGLVSDNAAEPTLAQ